MAKQSVITFEKRELPTAADPVRIEELKIGDTYFKVSYVDDDMTIPLVDSVVFIGLNLDGDEEDTLYFQDVESYRSGIRISDTDVEPEDATFYATQASTLLAMFDFEGALEELMRCSIRRKSS
jgi:hypothetical protein